MEPVHTEKEHLRANFIRRIIKVLESARQAGRFRQLVIVATPTMLGAVERVTGSCHLVQAGDFRILLDCGLIQGSWRDQALNAEPFPFDVNRRCSVTRTSIIRAVYHYW